MASWNTEEISRFVWDDENLYNLFKRVARRKSLKEGIEYLHEELKGVDFGGAKLTAISLHYTLREFRGEYNASAKRSFTIEL